MKIFAMLLLVMVSLVMVGCAGPGYYSRTTTVEYYGNPTPYYYQPPVNYMYTRTWVVGAGGWSNGGYGSGGGHRGGGHGGGGHRSR